VSLKVNIQKKQEGVYLVAPSGEINSETYDGLEKEVNAVLPSATALVFELKEVSYISSMGLGVIFRIKLAMEKKGGTIMLVDPQPQVQAVFDTMKVLPEHMFASLEEADDYLDTFLDGIQKGKIQPHPPKI
jgi:anti-anti-sigma factor